jgi:dienelactone hydrolase
MRNVYIIYLTLLLCISIHPLPAHAQTGPQTLPDLYNGIQPGHTQQLRSLVTHSLILPDTKPEEWLQIRERILKRVMDNWGGSPVPLTPAKNAFQELERYKKSGLTHIKFRYQVVDDIWNEAVCVLPAKFESKNKYKAVLTVHGTNGKVGKDGVLGTTAVKNRSYGIELAQRGYVTFSPDQFGYGSTINNITEADLYKTFYQKYPKWSVRGIRMLFLIRALDVLDQLSFVETGNYGSMGNSLGGASVLFHTAIDYRVKAAVPSTGISPAWSNVYRLLSKGKIDEPIKWEKIEKDGVPGFDIHEIIALCAPRAVLGLEPFNDYANPDAWASMDAVYNASHVYRLLGTPSHLSFLVHGDGHDTVADVREFAYKWLDRFLYNKIIEKAY